MQEIMIGAALNKVIPNYGIDIEGWDRTTFTKSAGAISHVVNGKTIYDFSNNAVNWLRIPYGTSPSPLAEDNEIIVAFNIRSIAASQRLSLWSRYKQGVDSPSAMIIILANGNILYVTNNSSLTTTGVVTFNQDHEIKYTRSGSTYTIYLDGVQIFQHTRTGSFQANWDWVFGSYLTAGDAVITSTFAYPVNWSLLGVTIKRI